MARVDGRPVLPGYDQKIDLAFLAQANLSAELPRWRELAAKLASG